MISKKYIDGMSNEEFQQTLKDYCSCGDSFDVSLKYLDEQIERLER